MTCDGSTATEDMDFVTEPFQGAFERKEGLC